ncbi:MAG TPA: hypothetical protein VF834_06810, partial [Streptosporangiaceae bacterium]
LSEKILFGEVKAGQIIMVDTEGTGKEAKFTFKGVPKPEVVPDTPPVELAKAAGGTGTEAAPERGQASGS